MLKKLVLATTLVAWVTSTLWTSYAMEEINGYQFQDNGLLWLKVQLLDPNAKEWSALYNKYGVSLAIRTLKDDETTKIDSIDSSIFLDNKVWDLDALAKDLDSSVKIETGVFTNPDEIDAASFKDSFFKFKATTNVGFASTTPTEILSFSVSPKADNTEETTEVTLDATSTRLVNTKGDPQANLFSGELSVEVADILTGGASEEDAATEEVTEEEVTEETTEEEVVEEEVDATATGSEETTATWATEEVKEIEKIETGAKEGILVVLLSLMLIGSAGLIKRTNS